MNREEFRNEVFRRAPELSGGSLMTAVDEFELRGEYGRQAVASCIERAGQIESSKDEPASFSKPARTRGTHVIAVNALQWLPRWAETQRRALFKRAAPPYRSVRDAARWVQIEMNAGARTPDADVAQERWRDVQKAVTRFHEASLGWCSVVPEARTIEFQHEGQLVRRPVYPNAASEVIAFEQSVSEINHRTGIWPSALVKLVLTGKFDSSAFQRIAWTLSTSAPTDDIPDASTVATLRLFVPDPRRGELRVALSELKSLWMKLPTMQRHHSRKTVMSEKLVRLLSLVKVMGGPPARSQEQFWTTVAAQTSYPSWNAAKQAYWRTTNTKGVRKKLSHKTRTKRSG